MTIYGRSHGYGKGRVPDVRWLLYGSEGGCDTQMVEMRTPTPLSLSPTSYIDACDPHRYDKQIVEMRTVDIEPTLHWLSPGPRTVHSPRRAPPLGALLTLCTVRVAQALALSLATRYTRLRAARRRTGELQRLCHRAY